MGLRTSLTYAQCLKYCDVTVNESGKEKRSLVVMSILEQMAPNDSSVITQASLWRRMAFMKEEGNSAFSSGDFRLAIQMYSNALLLDSNDIEFMCIIKCNRAAAKMHSEMYEEALMDCEEVLRVQPKYPRALL